MEAFLHGKNILIYIEYIYPKGVSSKNTGKIKLSLLTNLPSLRRVIWCKEKWWPNYVGRKGKQTLATKSNKDILSSLKNTIIEKSGDFPGGREDRSLSLSAGDTGSIPGMRRFHRLWSNQARGPQLRALCPAALAPQRLCSAAREARAPRLESALLCTAGERPRAAAKTPRSPGGGRGSPLQCSCLENPRGRGARWAATSGSQSRTRLRWLSSSMHIRA